MASKSPKEPDKEQIARNLQKKKDQRSLFAAQVEQGAGLVQFSTEKGGRPNKKQRA